MLLLERPFPGLFTAGRNPFPAPGSLSWSQWLGNATLTETWRWHLGGSGLELFLTPAWTLCYEEQFYVVMGLLMLLGRRGLFFGALVICAVSLLVVRTSIGKAWTVWGFFFDGHWLAFAAGILVYQQVNYAKGLRSRWPVLLLLLGMAYYLRALRGQQFTIAPNNLYQALAAAFAFALVLLILRPWDERIARTPLLRPLMWCGRMCYSLYLVHWPVCKAVSHATYEAVGWRADWQILWLNVPLCMVCCLPAGAAFYLLVERHFLNAPSGRLTQA
jgi:peptidoglycan/LPS O-acetylase OafA/YrhL